MDSAERDDLRRLAGTAVLVVRDKMALALHRLADLIEVKPR